MGISENPAIVWGAKQPQHLSSVGFRNSLLLGWCFEVLFADWRQLWRVRTMCSDVTGLLFKQEHCWMCGTVLSVGISFMSAACFLWNLACGFQRGVEAWPFNKVSDLFLLSWQGLSAIVSVAMASSVKQKSYGINSFVRFYPQDKQLALKGSYRALQCFFWLLSEVFLWLFVCASHKR